MNWGSTLRLSFPFGRAAVLAFCVLALTAVLVESFARTDYAETHLPASAIGNPLPAIEIKLARLKRLIAQQGKVDCFFVGSSMTVTGIDPAIVEQAYKEQSGETIRCFNFGVGGFTAESSAWLASFLVQEYHPRLLIFGTDARDYSAKTVRPTQAQVLSPWIEHHLGHFTWQGWLVDHSAAYGHLLTFRNWTYADFGGYLAEMNTFSDLDGYPTYLAGGPQGPIVRGEVDLTRMPDPGRPEAELGLFDQLADYHVSPTELAGLGELLAYSHQNVQVVVVQMPVHPTYYGLFSRGEQDYELFISEVSRYVAQADGIFLDQTTQPSIPPGGWYDRNHLNVSGATVFSRWLGQQLPVVSQP